MNKDEQLALLSDREFLDNLYAFCYKRCANSYEAEDLASEIVIDILASVERGSISGENESSFYAFAWTVARRRYADHSDRKNKELSQVIASDYSDETISASVNPIDDFIDADDERDMVGKIVRRIAFLSKIYREVMTMYYLRDIPTSKIAQSLGISESAVKQRLFTARKSIRNEVTKMDKKSLTFNNVDFLYAGTGLIVGNFPAKYAQRKLAKNILYLCRKEAKSAQEIAETLGVPMIYIEDELGYQCRGENGEYGILREIGGKYISNIIVADTDEKNAAFDIVSRHISDEFYSAIKDAYAAAMSKLDDFPFITRAGNAESMLWLRIPGISWSICCKIGEAVSRYFSDVEESNRPYTLTAVAHIDDENPKVNIYGNETNTISNFLGYESVIIRNTRGKHLEMMFRCKDNLYIDPIVALVIRCIGGMDIDSLSETDKEHAAKALHRGLIRKNGSIIEPNIFIIDYSDFKAFNDLMLTPELYSAAETAASKIAQELAPFIVEHIPQHLIGDHRHYTTLIAASGIDGIIIDKLIEDGLLASHADQECSYGTMICLVSKE